MEKFRQSRKAIAVIAYIAALVSAFFIDLSWLQNISRNMILLASGICFILLCSSIIFTVISGKAKFIGILIYFAEKLLFMFVLVVIAFGLSNLKLENEAVQLALFYGYCILIVIGQIVYYLHNRKKQNLKAASSSVRKSAAGTAEIKYLVKELHGALMLMIICQGILLLFKGNYLPLIFLLSTSLASLTLWKLFQWRGWILLLNLAAFIYLCYSCISTGYLFPLYSLPDATVVTYLYGATMIPLMDLYTRKEATI